MCENKVKAKGMAINCGGSSKTPYGPELGTGASQS